MPSVGEAGGEGDGVLLGDADIEGARRGMSAPNLSSPVPDGMAAVMATMRVVLLAPRVIEASANTVV